MNVETTEQISSETIALIESQARLAGLSIDDYLRSLLPNGNGKEKLTYKTRSPQQRAEAIKKWAESHTSDTPALALEDISRETIY